MNKYLIVGLYVKYNRGKYTRCKNTSCFFISIDDYGNDIKRTINITHCDVHKKLFTKKEAERIVAKRNKKVLLSKVKSKLLLYDYWEIVHYKHWRKKYL